MLQNSQRDGATRQFSRKQHFIEPAQTKWTHIQRLSAENKEDLLCIPLQADYRSIWSHTISSVLSGHDPSHVQLP
jgi:hypothetical protein